MTNTAYYFLIIFIVLAFCLFRPLLPFSVLLYIYLLIISFVPLLLNMRARKINSLILTGCLLVGIEIVFYFINRNTIGSLELWADEFRIITIARMPFAVIASEAFKRHVVALPLDYWNMHFVDMVVQKMPYYMHEFLYRVPYMLYHIMASGIFGITVLMIVKRYNHVRNTYAHNIIFILSGLLFFFFPPLLFFSIEVKFYALSILGIVLLIYLFVSDQLSDPKWYPLLLLFGLNTPQHYLVLGILSVVTLLRTDIHKSKRHNVLWLMAASILLISMWVGQISRESPHSFVAVTHSVLEYGQIILGLLFNTRMSVIFIICLIIASFMCVKHVSYFHLVIFEVLLLTTVGFGYILGYQHTGLRHIVFTFPFFILFIIAPLWLTSSGKFVVFMCVMYFLLVFQWISVDLPFIYRPFTKDVIGTKQIMDIAQASNSRSVVLACATANREDCDYIYESIEWYAKERHFRNEKIFISESDCGVIPVSRVLYVVFGVETVCTDRYSTYDILSNHKIRVVTQGI